MRVMAKIIGVKHIKRAISKQRNFSFLQVGKGVDTCIPPPHILPPPHLLSSPSLESRLLEPWNTFWTPKTGYLSWANYFKLNEKNV